MRKNLVLSIIASLFLLACGAKQPDRKIDYTSPCACYDVEKITKVGA